MIDFIDVSRHNKEILPEILENIKILVESGEYVLGKNVEKFEKDFAAYCGCKYAIGLNSGTDALIMALRSLCSVPDGEVLTVSMTFPATALAILAANLIPRYVDVDETGTMDPFDLKKKINSKTVAIIPVHFMGHVCNMKDILEIAGEIPVIEDACQAAGGSFNGKKSGSFGYAGCFSFFPTKNISCIGDGGMVTTNEQGTYERIKLLRNFGKVGRESFDFFGVNTRLDEIQAIILNEKLKRLDEWIELRRARAAYYDKIISGIAEPVRAPIGTKSTHHLYVIRVITDNVFTVEQMHKAGIDCRTHYSVPCHKQKALKSDEYLPHTDDLCKSVVTLPISEFISEKDQILVVDTLKTVLSSFN